MAAEKEVAKEENKFADYSEKLEKFFKNKTNVWMAVSVILAIALIASFLISGGMSKTKAGDYLVNALNERVGGGVTLDSVTSIGDLYEINVTYQGNEIPVYMTKDGKYMVMGVQPLIPEEGSAVANPQEETPKEVPKTDKPKVEAFVFSYCPYGLQFEKALSPVYTLLKNKADINIVAIGAMHGEYEKVESLRQLCIQKIYGKDKLWAYLDKFVVDTAIGNCNGDAACLTPLLKKIMDVVGIDKAKVDSCMSTDAEALYSADMARANSLGQSGSPGFMINGVDVSVGRTPEAIKTAICAAFTTAPAECSKTLSTGAATAGFGAGAGDSSGASCG